MPKIKAIMDPSNFKKMVATLPPKGLPFKAITGRKRGEAALCGGLYIGTKMFPEFEKHKKEFTSAQVFQGILRPSAKARTRLVLVTKSTAGPLKDVAKAALKSVRLPHQIVAMADTPGQTEPEPTVDDLRDVDEAPAPPAPLVAGESALRDKLSGLLSDVLKAKRDPKVGPMVTNLYEQIVQALRAKDLPAASRTLEQLRFLVDTERAAALQRAAAELPFPQLAALSGGLPPASAASVGLASTPAAVSSSVRPPVPPTAASSSGAAAAARPLVSDPPDSGFGLGPHRSTPLPSPSSLSSSPPTAAASSSAASSSERRMESPSGRVFGEGMQPFGAAAAAAAASSSSAPPPPPSLATPLSAVVGAVPPPVAAAEIPLPAAAPTPVVAPPPRPVADRFRDIAADYNRAVHAPTAYQGELERLFKQMSDLNRAQRIDEAQAVMDRLETLTAQTMVAVHSMDRARAKRVEVQQARHRTMSATFAGVKRTLEVGTAERYSKEKLKAGTEFKAFLVALGRFEKERTLANLALVERSAKHYLDHYTSGLSAAQKQHKESLRKKAICETTLRGLGHWRIALEFEQLGKPPWDFKNETLAAELQSKVLFEESAVAPRPDIKTFDDRGNLVGREPGQAEPPGQPGRRLVGANVNAAYWVNTMVRSAGPPSARGVVDTPRVGAPPEGDDDDPEGAGRWLPQKKAFLFKPLDTEAAIPGYPKGGSAAREVIGKLLADQIEAVTGLDLGVPETQLVRIANEKLPEEITDPATLTTKVGPNPLHEPQRLGSMQQFSESDGPLTAKWNNREFRNTIPREECEKMAILDLISLNLDRHPGNLLVGTQPGPGATPVPRLIPIDHGLIVPSRDGLSARRAQLGYPHSAITQLPGSAGPFSAAMREKLALLDPDKVAEGLQRSVDQVGSMYPTAMEKSQIKPDDNIRLVKRSTMFLKAAAAEGLTMREIYDAYAQDMEAIFDSRDDQVPDAFAAAIAKSRRRSAARRRFEDIWDNPARHAQVLTDLQRLGWEVGLVGMVLGAWCVRNQELVVHIVTSRPQVENPAVRAEVNAMVAVIGEENLDDFDPDELPAVQALSEVSRRYKKWRHERMGIRKPSAQEDANIDAYLAGDGDKLLRDNHIDPTGLRYPEIIQRFLEVRRRALPLPAARAAALARVKAAFPDDFPAPDKRPLTPAEEDERILLSQEYEHLGGDREYTRLGGQVGNLPYQTTTLRMLKKREPVLAAVRTAAAVPFIAVAAPAPTPDAPG